MTSEINFTPAPQGLPARERSEAGEFRYAGLYGACLASPGLWFHVVGLSKTSKTYLVKRLNGHRVSRGVSGHFEAAVRTVDGEARVFTRYVL